MNEEKYSMIIKIWVRVNEDPLSIIKLRTELEIAETRINTLYDIYLNTEGRKLKNSIVLKIRLGACS